MRRTICTVVVSLLAPMLMTSAAGARPSPEGAVNELSCSWGDAYVQPTPGLTVGWEADASLGSEPTIRLVWGYWLSPDDAPQIGESSLLTALDETNELSLCAITSHDPLVYAYFVRMPHAE